MASSLPLGPTLVLSSVAETLLLVKLIPQHLPEHPFVFTFIRVLAVNTFLWAVWMIQIYPFFFSPLRHLPGPKVFRLSRKRVCYAKSSRVVSLSLAMAWLYFESLQALTSSAGSPKFKMMVSSIFEAFSTVTGCLSPTQKR